MMNKMIETFRKKENREFFQNNEHSLDHFLGDTIGDYEANKDKLNYYQPIFKNMDNVFFNNSKLFSKLKHMCYDLGELLTKSGNLIHSISSMYSKIIEESNKLYEDHKIKIDKDVSDITKKLKVGLNEWGSQLKIQSTYVIDHMASFFHYKKHENLSFSGLLNAKMDFQATLVKNMTALNKEKKKLFDSKNTEKWKINYDSINGDMNDILKDFNKVKPHMLPDVV